MNKNPDIRALLFAMVVLTTSSCVSISHYGAEYYFTHEKKLDHIEKQYSALYRQHPFCLAFIDKEFMHFSLEIITDSMTYIYDFKVDESRLTDTLYKYGLNAPGICDLISDMQEIHCTWINNLEYYVDDVKNNLTFISLKPVLPRYPLNNKKYYILTFFQQPQYYDEDGHLLHKRLVKQLRKIKGEIFTRINDRVCYTESEYFR